VSRPRPTPLPASSAPTRTAVLHLVPIGDDALVAALRNGEPGAADALFDRYGVYVRRIVARVLGPDPDLVDTVHDVFVAALESAHRLEDAGVLRSWLTSIAVFTARARIRGRQRWRRFFVPWADRGPEAGAWAPTDAQRELRATYAVLDRMHVDDRIVFVLRFIEEMQLTEVAATLGTSLATVKRRLSRSRTRFEELAKGSPELEPWLQRGER
jgi:RNA polymerase sigma-70 factor, ECF subfamily